MSETEDFHDKLTQKLTPELLHNLVTQQQNSSRQMEDFQQRFQDWCHVEITAAERKAFEAEFFLFKNPIPVDLLRHYPLDL